MPDWGQDFERAMRETGIVVGDWEVKTDEDLYSVKDFKDCCEAGGFTDDDGYGVAVRDGKYLMRDGERVFVLASRANWIPSMATHVEWYNK